MASQGVASIFNPPLSNDDRLNLQFIEQWGRKALQHIHEKYDNSSRPGIFVDCGFNTGIITEYFLRELPNNFDFYGFELLESECRAQADALIRHYKNRNISVEFSAVSSANGIVDFSKSSTDISCFPNWGSTIVPGKSNVDYSLSHRIRSINFSEWLRKTNNYATKKNIHPFVIVKMDIEGSEFDVLEKMLEDKTASLMDTLLIEWHDQKFSNFEMRKVLSEKRQQISKELKEESVSVLEWQ